MRKDGGAAYPRTLLFEGYDDAREESQLSALSYSFMEGMSLRDLVALKVATNWISANTPISNYELNEEGESVDTWRIACKAAFNFAEIFCKERAIRRQEEFKNGNI
jgi:hypothetical protein